MEQTTETVRTEGAADEGALGLPALPPSETIAESVAPQPVQSTVTAQRATVRSVDGEVLIIAVDGAQGPAQPGQSLGPGDVVITQSGGALELVLPDGAAIFFDSDARVLLEEPETAGGQPQFFVIQGEFSVDNVGEPDSPVSELLIRTPVASVSVKSARMLGKAAPEAQLNTFVLLPGVAGAAAGSLAVSSSGAPVVIDQPLEGVQVISLFRDPSQLTDVDAALLANEFGAGVLAYSEVAGIPEIADTDEPGFLAQIGELFGVTEAQAETLLPQTDVLEGGEESDDLAGGEGDDDGLDEDNDDEFLNNNDDNNVTVINFDGQQTIQAIGDFEITGGAGNDTLTVIGDQVDANTVLFVGDEQGRVQLDFQSPEPTANILVDEVETIEVELGAGSDQVTFGDISNTDISNSTVLLDLRAGNDTVLGAAAGKSLNVDSGSGNDLIAGGGLDDTLDGGADTDLLDYSDANNAVTVDLRANTAQGFGNDQVTNFENVRGSGFGDTIGGDAGNNALDGGAGSDTANFSTAGNAVDANLQTGVATGDGNDTLTAFENLIGSAQNDVLTGDANNNVLAGRAGDDTLNGGDGVDVADFSTATGQVNVDLTAGTATGEGTDVLNNIEGAVGGAQADVLSGTAAADSLNGNAGDDTLIGLGGADTLDGGDGSDTADLSGGAAGVTIDLAAGTLAEGAAAGSISGIENVIATAQTDAVTGDGQANSITGGAGADTLIGNAGDDTLTGDAGTDRLAGGLGNDSLDGGAGAADTADFGASATAVVVDLTAGTATGEGNDTLAGIERVEGSAFADSITGDGNDNVISGAGGDDTLLGLGGNDRFGFATTENGNDQMFGGDGTDDLRLDLLDANGALVTIENSGNANNDVQVDMITPITQSALLNSIEQINVTGADGADSLTIDDLTGTAIGNGGVTGNLGGGADELDATTATTAVNIDGGAGNDTLTSGAGNDTLAGGDGTDLLNLSAAGADVIVDLSTGSANSANTGADQLTGIEDVQAGGGNDNLIGDAGANGLIGGEGNDTIDGGAGDDTLEGGDIQQGDTGTDLVSFASSANSVVVDLEAGTATGDGNDQLNGFEAVLGSAQADTITGAAGAESLTGGAGADVINGADGNDTLDGGAGDDTLDGGDGTDTAVFASAAAGVNVNLAAGTSTGDGNDSISNVENLIGTANEDTLAGDSLNNQIDGGVGADNLSGGDGNDTLLGNNGGDTLFGGLGDDVFDGGVGFDSADFSASQNAITVDLGANVINGVVTGSATGEGNDTLTGVERIVGTSQADVITGTAAAESFLGNDGNDSLTGLGGADTLNSGAGDDTLLGGDGSDSLSGGGDNDTVDGGAGDDTLDGEAGSDRLTGGDGADAFFYDTVLNHSDVITDFVAGTDRFLIDGTAFGNIARDGNNNLIDTQSFVTVAGALNDGVTNLGTNQATFVFDGVNNLHFDPDGDGQQASFEIGNVTVNGQLAATDFQVQ